MSEYRESVNFRETPLAVLFSKMLKSDLEMKRPVEVPFDLSASFAALAIETTKDLSLYQKESYETALSQKTIVKYKATLGSIVLYLEGGKTKLPRRIQFKNTLLPKVISLVKNITPRNPVLQKNVQSLDAIISRI